MGQNAQGAFVVSWSQIELDGRQGAPLSALARGASLLWRGEATRIDGPRGIIMLGAAKGEQALRQRIAHRVRCRTPQTPSDAATEIDNDDPLMDHGFAVTDGRKRWNVAVIDQGAGHDTLCMFDQAPPPAQTILWVVSSDMARPVRYLGDPVQRGVICFTPGTLIRTADGAKRVEDLDEGDSIQTKDNGVQPIQWIGSREITGARLHAMPHLAPVRLRAGAMGDDIPDGELLVSPDHRMVLRGARARALFNCDEVLVAARDLVDGHGVIVDRSVQGLRYIHIALPAHEVVFANGVETESFHPMSAGLDSLTPDDRARLLERVPELDHNPHAYGDLARRSLTRAEAAILRGDAGLPPRRA